MTHNSLIHTPTHSPTPKQSHAPYLKKAARRLKFYKQNKSDFRLIVLNTIFGYKYIISPLTNRAASSSASLYLFRNSSLVLSPILSPLTTVKVGSSYFSPSLITICSFSIYLLLLSSN